VIPAAIFPILQKGRGRLIPSRRLLRRHLSTAWGDPTAAAATTGVAAALREKILTGYEMDTSEKIWQGYYSKLHAFIKSRISDDAAADDVLQNVFLKMHYGLASLKDDSKLKSWLYQVARNAVIDYFRSRKPSVELSDQLPQPETDPREKIIQELSDCLHPMIQLLPEHYREAVVLSELKGLTQKEVAEAQGISLSGAKSRVQRGRALLKNMLIECCRIEFDHSGQPSDYERKGKGCGAC
jgi:RNA polymerase sigma-70 factor (ECF subfamily)